MNRILNATLILAAASLSAQEPPRPAKAPRPGVEAAQPAPPAPSAIPAPGTLPAPSTAPTPAVAIAPGVWAIAPVPAFPSLDWQAPAPPVVAVQPGVTVIEAPEAYVIAPQGQGRPMRIDQERVRELAEHQREMARIQAEQQREMSRRQSELSRELTLRQAEIAREYARDEAGRNREMARAQAEMQREMAQHQAQIQREHAREMAQHQAEINRQQAQINREFNQNYNYNYNFSYTPGPMAIRGALPERPPAAWAQNDPADSLWRAANDVMGRGDYRRAATMFKEIPVRFKYSAYAVDAMYWQAHALYRVGGIQDLQEALGVLETLKATYPSQRIRGSNADVGALQVRIAGVLSAKGMGSDRRVREALDANKNICDREEVQIRSAALNALMQTDAAAAQDYAVKALAKKDECSRELRQNAVYLLGNKRDPQHTKTLIDVARNDPSQDVRSSAIEYLGRTSTDDALSALEDLLKTSDDQQIQRSAIRALANNSNPRARAGIKALVERNDVNENLRIAAIDALREELATTEDVNWLQALYPKVESARIRSRIISAMSRLGGTQNERWFTTLANNENESIDVRIAAIRTAGQTMDIAALKRLYDQTGQRQLRQEIVRQFGNRREPESIDVLGDIAKTGTDPQVRQAAISALTNKKDERATKLLLQLIDRP